MNRLITAISLLLVLSGCKTPENQSFFTQEKAHEYVNDFFKALSTGDSTLMANLLTEDFEMYEHEVLWNQDSLLSLMPLTQGRVWRVDSISFHVDEDIAHVYYFNESDKPKGRSWYESMLFIRESDKWRIRFMHSTKLYLK